MLRFKWRLEADDFNEECDVQLLCRHAVQRGVHVPSAWKVPAVDALARAAVQRARFLCPMQRNLTAGSLHKHTRTHTGTCTSMHTRAWL